MFRVLWRFPLYGSGATVAAPTSTFAESWAWPIGFTRMPYSSTSIVRGIPDLIESGHKEN